MRKIVSLLLVGLLVSGSVFAKNAKEVEKPRRDMAVTWNPLSLLMLTASGSYGIALGERLALIIPLSLTYVSTGISDNSSSASSYLFGVSSGAGLRFYFSGGAFEDGFYVQPNVSIGWLKFGSDGANSLSIGANALLGYSWVFDSGFMMNLAAGAGYTHSSVKTDSSAGAFKISGVFPALEFAIGYAW
ncbi:MAG: hypothetical protein WCK49_09650 [Myxococcaceae bacterium]